MNIQESFPAVYSLRIITVKQVICLSRCVCQSVYSLLLDESEKMCDVCLIFINQIYFAISYR